MVSQGRSPLLALLALACACFLGCSSSGSNAATTDASSVGDGATDTNLPDPDLKFGGTRPVTVRAPAGYDGKKATPLVILLHGYGAGGFAEDFAVTNLADYADTGGYLFAAPDGTVDSKGNKFWNATDACCDFDGKAPDDVKYLTGLVHEISGVYNVDPKRVFFVGHSNGGFMANRLACDAADVIAAVVSLAGATWKDQTKCKPAAPISVLLVHGDKDPEVLYAGSDAGVDSATGSGPYPGAVETADDWATQDTCTKPPSTSANALQLIPSDPGKDTDDMTYAGCKSGSSVELWTIHGAGHIPDFGGQFGKTIWERFLSKHAKP